MKMSTYAKQATPNRCCCRVQDDGVSLNEIAKIITVLNFKILRLRNEVSDLKNVNPDKEMKLFNKTEPTCRHFSHSCKRELDNSLNNVRFDKFIASGESKTLVNLFETDLKNNYKTEHTKIDEEILKNTIETDQFLWNEKLQQNCKSIFENKQKRRRKRISQGIQCDSTMERKRKRTLLNCFKTGPHIKEHNSLKSNKKMKLPLNTHIAFNPDKQVNLRNTKTEKDEEILQLESYVYNEENTTQEETEQATNRPKNEKLQETKISNSELANNEYKVDLLNGMEDKCQLLKFSISRMGGGAEGRGNRLISDFQDKIQKINLYKNVKFDAKNVKKRLDACIDELNGIIEDISLILPYVNISKKLQE